MSKSYTSHNMNYISEKEKRKKSFYRRETSKRINRLLQA